MKFMAGLLSSEAGGVKLLVERSWPWQTRADHTASSTDRQAGYDGRMPSQAELVNRAVQAVVRVARELGIDCIEPTVLHHSEHVSVRLYPASIVARVLGAEQPNAARELCRELAVAQHLVRRGAPVVGPTTDIAPGPHFLDHFGLTLWQFVEHVGADWDNREHMASAALALRRVHHALADFPSELPSFRVKIDRCRALLEDDLATPALAAADRSFLRAAYERINTALDALRLDPVPIHGDAGCHNVFITPQGAYYSDFEDVSLGPREWDIGFFPDAALSVFGSLDRELLFVLSDLRSLCVSVWCWAKYDMAEKREAAEYHLQYLKERFG
jgi:hypothetical protein